MKSWTDPQLIKAVSSNKSVRKVLQELGLKPTGGNYKQIKKYIGLLSIDTAHFTGKLWSKGLKIVAKPRLPLYKILVKDSDFQSHKLKVRLFRDGIKAMSCEECGWKEKSPDGRIPLELDHINGDSHDNRIENLRILCPNCHSLKPSHRGRNIGKIRR